MFTLILLPTFIQNAVAEDQRSKSMEEDQRPNSMEEVIVRGVRLRSSWVGICMGSSNCRSFLGFGLSDLFEFLGEVIGIGVDEDDVELVVLKKFRSSKDYLNCASDADERRANVPSSIGFPALLGVPRRSTVLILYSNEQSELFIRSDQHSTFQFVPVPGSCG